MDVKSVLEIAERGVQLYNFLYFILFIDWPPLDFVDYRCYPLLPGFKAVVLGQVRMVRKGCGSMYNDEFPEVKPWNLPLRAHVIVVVSFGLSIIQLFWDLITSEAFLNHPQHNQRCVHFLWVLKLHLRHKVHCNIQRYHLFCAKLHLLHQPLRDRRLLLLLIAHWTKRLVKNICTTWLLHHEFLSLRFRDLISSLSTVHPLCLHLFYMFLYVFT